MKFIEMVPIFTPIAAILTALAAVIISPIVTYLTSHKQIRANLISANRQAWIDKLRDELSELFELLTWQYFQRPGTLSGEEGYKYEAEKRSRIRLLKNKIRLRLNPLEADSQALLDLITRLEISASKGSQRDEIPSFEQLMDDAVKAGQTILKAEWMRVKKGR
jgi:hypothetical protein